MYSTPILLIAFNRPETTTQVWNIIKILKPIKLFVSVDGPREDNSNDTSLCVAVKSIVLDLDWECDVKYLFHEQNLGCGFAPRAAFNWFFEHVEEGIILEDDCLPSIDFFKYCEALLEKYRHNTKVLTINGSNLGYNFNSSYSYTYSRFMNMTGWATWRRSAKAIDYSLSHWRNVKHKLLFMYFTLKQNIFDIDVNWYKYWESKFNKTLVSENITWWDWQWIYYQITNKKYSIVPSRNMVTNIGFNEKGTHTKNVNDPASLVPIEAMHFPLRHPPELKNDLHYEEQFVKRVWCGYQRLPASFYIKKYIKKALRLNKSRR